MMFGGDDTGGFFGGGGAGSDRMPTCRVCSQKFATFPELKQHIREENHHDINMTKPSPNTTLNPTASTFIPGGFNNNNTNNASTPFVSKKSSKSFPDSNNISSFNKSPEMNPFTGNFNSTSIPPRDKAVMNSQLFPWGNTSASSSQDSTSTKTNLNPFAPSNPTNNNSSINNPFVKSILKSGFDDQKGDSRHVNFKLGSSPDKLVNSNNNNNPFATANNNVSMNPFINPFTNPSVNQLVSPGSSSSDSSWKRQGTPAHGAIMKPNMQPAVSHENNDVHAPPHTDAFTGGAPRVKLKGKIKASTTAMAPSEAPSGLVSGKKVSPRKVTDPSSGSSMHEKSEKWICRYCDVQCSTSDEFEAHNRR
jgi:hypothetical protein